MKHSFYGDETILYILFFLFWAMLIFLINKGLFILWLITKVVYCRNPENYWKAGKSNSWLCFPKNVKISVCFHPVINFYGWFICFNVPFIMIHFESLIMWISLLGEPFFFFFVPHKEANVYPYRVTKYKTVSFVQMQMLCNLWHSFFN